MASLLHDRSPPSGAPRAASAGVDSEEHQAGEGEGPGGGGAVTGRTGRGTNGGGGGTSGWTPTRVIVAGCMVWLALLLIQMSVNAMSQASENPNSPAWPYWSWEGSSAVGWIAAAPLLWQLVRRLPRLARRPAVLVLALAAATVALSLVHVAVMFGLRFAIYPLLGESYEPYRGLADTLLYEYRKDVSTLLQMGLGFYFVQWLATRVPYWTRLPDGAAPEPRSEVVVEVQDGPSTHFIPLGEIAQASAAGNYVEIAWRGRTLLHRTTLAALEQAWAPHGFVRVHRGTLMRAASVVRIEALKSGDFQAELTDGTLVRGSRRYRAALDGALQAP
ncbi:MAG TPA: LytTR family DNA-binding domain-containing protein [Croceibacterium sp.]